jgi:glucose/arabinose dehydrogenase
MNSLQAPSKPRQASRRSAERALSTAVLTALLAGAGGFRSQDQQPPAATAPAATAPAAQSAPADAGAGANGAVANSVVVTSLEGKARARRDPDAAWQIVEIGMRLPQGAEIQTGPTARVVCSVPPGREFVVDRMSKVTVLEAEQTGNRLKTDLMMEYGRTDLRVQKAGLEQDARIRTPGANGGWL